MESEGSAPEFGGVYQRVEARPDRLSIRIHQ